jgi:flagellar basal body-associated protein FliL
MSFFNNLVKTSIAGGIVVGSAVAYAQLNDEQRQKLHSGVNRLRRKVADLIAPNDGAYTLPKEVEAELEALLNNEEIRRGPDDTV